jgi:hypothetical protein
VADAGEGDDLVGEPRLLQRGPRRVAGGVHPVVLLGVDAEDGRPRAGEVGAVGQRAVEGHGGGQARLGVRQQQPGHSAAEAEPHHAELGAGRPDGQLVQRRLHVGDEPLGRDLTELGRGLGGVAEGLRAALA